MKHNKARGFSMRFLKLFKGKSLVKNVIFKESIDEFSVIFGGQAKIDVEVFTKVVNETLDLVKIAAEVIEPGAFTRLEIKANEKGSFVTTLDAVIKYTPTLFTKENLDIAVEILNGFVAFLAIKLHLKGAPPSSINTDKQLSSIVNCNNETLIVPENITNEFFRNASINKSTVIITNSLKEGKVQSISVKRNGGTIHISEKDYEIFGADLTDEIERINNPVVTESRAVIENCELEIGKPDLKCVSMWGCIYNGKKISVTIEDKDFINDVLDRKIKFGEGDRVIGTLEIITSLNNKLEPGINRYNLIKVFDIKEAPKQKSLIPGEG